MFRIEAIGNLGGDAEIKNDNGRQYVQFSVADTRKFKKEDGTEVEQTNWISCFYRNTDSEVVKYLKKGTKVFVRGNGELRLFSSAKDRMMKAGASINVNEIELVGGSAADDVPRELALPNGMIIPIMKFYAGDYRNLAQMPTVLYDRRGQAYNVDAKGWIKPSAPLQQPAEQQQQQTAAQQQQQPAQQQQQPQQEQKKLQHEYSLNEHQTNGTEPPLPF